MTARSRPSDRRQELVDLLTPVVASFGYELEDVSVAAAGRRSVVRVVLDSDTGIDLDDVAEVSRGVSELLDDDSAGAAVFDMPYVLEVTSPGVDRPLTEPKHWRRAVGRLVTTTLDGEPVRGRITAADGAGVVLDVGGQPVEVSYEQLPPGRVEVEFSRPGESNDHSAEPDGLEPDDTVAASEQERD